MFVISLSTGIFAQSDDSTKFAEKTVKKDKKTVSKPPRKKNSKPDKINFDRFIDLDGDGISDSRGRGFGLRNRLLIMHKKNSGIQQKNRGNKNGKE